MSNQYFKCKQFMVQQQHCAMKVTTDACLFGAWAAASHQAITANSIVDIGAGTGLLSLMLAQKTNANILAIEIDDGAATQSKENFKASPWQHKLSIHHGSLQAFVKASTNSLTNHSNVQFDFIVSNPPFFENDLKSDDAKRNVALHSAALSLEELAQAVQKLLAANGNFAVLLPYPKTNFFIEVMAKENLLLQSKTLVRQTPTHSFFRSMLLFGKKEVEVLVDEIIIKDESNLYTSKFKALLQDYYLYL
jgi:tRNA1Val (adenine37-N6)-methyltransferase